MPLAVPSSVVYESSAAATIHTIGKPLGTIEGDLMSQVWSVRSLGGAGLVWDTDWTERVFVTDAGNAEYLAQATKRAGPAEPSTYDFNIGGGASTRNVVGFNVRITGDDIEETNPVHQSATTDESSNATTHPSPSVTTLADNCLIFYAIGDSGFGAYTEDAGAPAGTTVIGAKVSNGGASDQFGGLAYKILSSAGASGAGNWASDSNTQAVTATFAIKPAAPPAKRLDGATFRGIGRGMFRGMR